MIVGSVNRRLEAVIPVVLRSINGREIRTEGIIDTGYNGLLTLPAAMSFDLGLVAEAGGTVTLGDASVVNYSVFLTEVDFGDGYRIINASAIGNEILIGTGLLDGYELRAQFKTGGTVQLIPLT